MRRTSRNNAVCFESLEKALAESPETYGHLDLIAFGFPCTDISSANPKGKGLAGEKSSIFFECMRIVQTLLPKWILIENVPRLLSINNGRDMATVLQTLAQSGYWWAYRILDSQFFGLAQRRKRVFIIGSLGNTDASEILAELQSSSGDDKKKQEMGPRGLCLSTRDGGKQDLTSETLIVNTIRADDKRLRKFGFGENIVAETQQSETLVAYTVGTIDGSNGTKGGGTNLVAQTIGATPRGNTNFIWQDTYIEETNPGRKRSIAGIQKGMDSRRGIVIGNAVSVPVAQWIGERIMKYESKFTDR